MNSRKTVLLLGLLWLFGYAQDPGQVEFDPAGSEGCQTCLQNQWWIPGKKFQKNDFQKLFQYLGWESRYELHKIEEVEDELEGTHLYFQQHHKGIPVQDALIHARVQNGSYQFLQGKLIPSEFLPDTQAILPPNVALSQALEKLRHLHFAWEHPDWENELKESSGKLSESYFPSPKLIYAPGNLQHSYFKLVYLITLRSIEPDEEYKVWISAVDGNILKSMPHSTFCQPANASFESLYYGGQNIDIRYRGWPFNDYLLESCSPSEIETRLYETNSFGEGRSWSRLSKISLPSQKWGLHQQEAVTAHWCLQQSLDFFANEAGWLGPSASGEKIRLLVDWTQPNGQSQQNARYLKSRDIHYLYFGEIEGQSLASLDVVGHEFGHAFINEFAALNPERESGALAEGLADILGFLTEKYQAGVSGNWDWTIGEDVMPLRSLSDPHSFAMPSLAAPSDPFWEPMDENNCPQAISGYPPAGNDNCGIHQNSGIVSHWFYLLTQGGEQNGIMVRPISIESGSEIVFRLIKYYLLPTSDFLDARKASLRAAEDIFGFCSHELAQVKNAWAAVGVGESNHSECISIIGSSELCLNEAARQYLYEAIGPEGAQFEWQGIPSSWSYRFQGESKQFLSIEDLPEVFESVEISLIARWDGKKDTTYLLLQAVECGQKAPRQPDPIPDFDKIRIYPNPGQSKVHIFMPEGSFPAEIEVYDSRGKLVLRRLSNQSLFSFGVESWNRGIYVIKVRSSKLTWQDKLLVI